MQITLHHIHSFQMQGQRNYQEDSRYPNVDVIDPSQRFFIICDGVGGCERGDVASMTVTSSLAKSLNGHDRKKAFTTADLSRALGQAYQDLDKMNSGHAGNMATTLILVVFHVDGVMLAHIGDSRIYQLRKNEGIIYRSNDHSMVNDMVHHGVISPEQAATDPRRNVITRYLEPDNGEGARFGATVLSTNDVLEGDYFFMCSDGVLQCLSEEQLYESLCGQDSDQSKMERLAQLCKESSDNSTAFLIRVAKSDAKPQPQDSPVPTNGYTQRLEKHESVVVDIEPEMKKGGFFEKIAKIFKLN